MTFKTPRIIALVGPKRCGKDTIAKILEPYGYTNFKISQRLKNVCKELFGFTDIELESDLKDLTHSKWQVTPRHIMQVFGTEIMQFEMAKFVPCLQGKRTFWVERFCEDIKMHEGCVVITDMRFMHEYEYIHNAFKDDLLVIQVTRDNITSTETHVSEHEWSRIPCAISLTNNGTIDELTKNIASSLLTTR